MSDLRIYRNVFQSLTNLLLSNLREQSAHFSLYQRKNTEVFCKQHSCQTSRPYWMTDIHCPMKIKLTEATSHLIGPFLSAYGDIIHFKHETCKSSVISLTVTFPCVTAHTVAFNEKLNYVKSFIPFLHNYGSISCSHHVSVPSFAFDFLVEIHR